MSLDHGGAPARVCAGVDWAKDDHAVCILDAEGDDACPGAAAVGLAGGGALDVDPADRCAGDGAGDEAGGAFGSNHW